VRLFDILSLLAQLLDLCAGVPAQRLEVTLHQHLPLFHNEHCVYSHLLSNGHDFRDCGRPCEKHLVQLRDALGMVQPVIVDVGCRNTVFNARAQSAAGCLPQLLGTGVRRFRVELVREPADETRRVLNEFGVAVMTLEDAIDRKAQVVQQFRGGQQRQVDRRENLHLYRGHGRFVAPDRLQVGDEMLESPRFFINTGTRPEIPPMNRLGVPPEVVTWADRAYLKDFADQIAALRRETDLVVASCHWGLGEEVLAHWEIAGSSWPTCPTWVR